MSELIEQLTSLAGDGLRGEQPVAAVVVNYAGKLNVEHHASGIASLYQADQAVAAGEELAERMGRFPNASFPTAKSMALLLTDKRVVAWSRGGLKGKPKNLLGDVPLAAISEVRYEEGRVGDRLTVTMWSGWEIALDPAGKGESNGFAEQFKTLVAEANQRDVGDGAAADGAGPDDGDGAAAVDAGPAASADDEPTPSSADEDSADEGAPDEGRADEGRADEDRADEGAPDED